MKTTRRDSITSFVVTAVFGALISSSSCSAGLVKAAAVQRQQQQRDYSSNRYLRSSRRLKTSEKNDDIKLGIERQKTSEDDSMILLLVDNDYSPTKDEWEALNTHDAADNQPRSVSSEDEENTKEDDNNKTDDNDLLVMKKYDDASLTTGRKLEKKRARVHKVRSSFFSSKLVTQYPR